MPIKYDELNDKIEYVPMDEPSLRLKVERLISIFEKYWEQQKIEEEVSVQRTLLPTIFTRVDKREGYFAVYHNQTSINEIKQAALVCYWILRFRPFLVSSRNPEISKRTCRINEGFAMFYLLGTIRQSAKARNHVFTRPSDALINELRYAFSYWDLSKEAVILIAETLGETLAGIPAQGVEG